MRKIPLTQGKYALVDNADFESLSRFNWYLKPTVVKNGTSNRFYAARTIRNNGKQSSEAMHRTIMGIPPKGLECDHIDRNGLNNQRNNIRFVTRSENLKNRSPYRKPKAVGAIYKKDSKKWQAQKTIMIGGKMTTKYLGLYPTKELAMMAFENYHKLLQ